MMYKYSYSDEIEAFPFNGNCEQLKEILESKKLFVIGGTANHYLIGRSSSGIIYEYPDDTSSTPTRVAIPSKDMLRKRYNRSLVTEREYARLTDELNRGCIDFNTILHFNSSS